MGDAGGKIAVLRVCLVVFALALAGGRLRRLAGAALRQPHLAGLAAGGVIPLALAMVGDAFAFERRQVAISAFLAAALDRAAPRRDLVGRHGRLGPGGDGRPAVTPWRPCWPPWASSGGFRPGRQRSGAFSVADAMGRYRLVFANPRSLVCFGTVFVEGLAIYGVLPFVPELLQARGGGTATQAGFVIAGLGLGGMAFSASVSLLLRRFPAIC